MLRVVVTGASQGIGAGIARRFAEAGANVVVHYRNGRAGADATVKEISENNGTAVAIQAELASEQGSGNNADPIRSTGIGSLRNQGQRRISGPYCTAWH